MICPFHSMWSKNSNALFCQGLRAHHDPCRSLNFTALWPILITRMQSHNKGNNGMDWKKLLGSISESANDELRLRIAYLTAGNRILPQQIHGRVPLTDNDRKELAERGRQSWHLMHVRTSLISVLAHST